MRSHPGSLALGIGVLLLQFGFILSYIGAFHAPAPHRIPVTVVAPPQVASQLVDRAQWDRGRAGQRRGTTTDEGGRTPGAARR